jgi:hypothetical protein
LTRAPPPFTAPDVTRALPTRERCTRSTRVAYVRRRGSAVSPSVDLGGSKTRTVLETVTVRFSRAAGGDSGSSALEPPRERRCPIWLAASESRRANARRGREREGDAARGRRPSRAPCRTRESQPRTHRSTPEPPLRPGRHPQITRKSSIPRIPKWSLNPLTFDPRAHPTPTARTTPIGASA